MTFRRESPEAIRARRQAERQRTICALLKPIAKPRAVTYGGSLSGHRTTKEQIVRSEEYRRLVASLPCSYCRIEGYSQAAHPPPTAKSRKECDLQTFPLCATRPGVTGCHVEFDQMRLIQRAAMRTQAEELAAKTRSAIRHIGWPKNVPDPGN